MESVLQGQVCTKKQHQKHTKQLVEFQCSWQLMGEMCTETGNASFWFMIASMLPILSSEVIAPVQLLDDVLAVASIDSC